MLTRIITAACLLPLVAVVYFGPPVVFLLLTLLCVSLAVRETLLLHEAPPFNGADIANSSLGLKAASPVAAAALVGGALACVSFHDPLHLPLGLALGASLALTFGLRAVLRPSLENALQDVNQAQSRAGDLSAAYERGETVDIAKVMLARQEAAVGFEATLQVRNKLLSAYQNIMNMPV